MKQNELQKCASCGKGVMHSGCPIFYRVKIERMAVNMPAVERQHGLELVLGRNAALANIMGPNEDLAKPLGEAVNVIICQDCSINSCVAMLHEVSAEKDEEIDNG